MTKTDRDCAVLGQSQRPKNKSVPLHCQATGKKFPFRALRLVEDDTVAVRCEVAPGYRRPGPLRWAQLCNRLSLNPHYPARRMNDHTPATFLGEMIGRLRQWPGLLWRLEGSLKGVEFQGRYEILGRPIMSVAKGGRLVLGDDIKIYSATRANPLGCFQPCVLRALLPGSQLVLGRGVGLSGTVICSATSIEVGEGTIFGSGAMAIDNDFHSAVGDWEWTDDPKLCAANARPIKIGRGIFVGARAIILKGVTIGDRAVIGAGAVVTKDVPARHLAVGNPAKISPL